MLTLLLATRDRAATLAGTLPALARLERPRGGWRLVVVDNGSTDRTRSVAESFGSVLPLKYAYEPTKGKNAALNTGLEYIIGDLVVFTDDDVVPRSDWLQQIRKMADQQACFSIFGGPVLPMWKSTPPFWILEWVPLGPTYTILYPRLEGPSRAVRVFGPNMAIRASVFAEGHRFDERFGPRGKRYPMGSETELILRLEKSGYRTWHCPRAVVYHVIGSEQLSEPWVLSRAFRFGRGMYRLQVTTSQDSAFSAQGSKKPLPRELLSRCIQLRRSRLGRNREEIFKHQWLLRYHAGRALEAGRLMRDRMQKGLAAGPGRAVPPFAPGTRRKGGSCAPDQSLKAR